MNNQPFKIIDINNNRLQLCQQGINKLKQIKGYVFPISSVGPILTGKSSLLNQLLGRKIFKVGDTTIPTTKGVYAYVHQVRFQYIVVPIYYIYLDVQGFDDSFSYNNEQIDIQLLLLMVSICKVVMYNSFGAIDSKILERVASLSDLVPNQLKNNPNFILVQKNFNLRLTNKDNQSLNSEQYLEHCLRSYKQKTTINKLNSIFKFNNDKSSNLSCVLLPNTGQASKYQRQISAFKSYIQCLLINQIKIQSNIQIKYLQNVHFIYNLIECIELRNNKSSLRQLNNIIDRQKQEQGRTFFAAFKSSLIEKTKTQIKSQFPMPEQLLFFKFKKAINQCLENLGGKSQSSFIIQLISPELIDQFQRKNMEKLKLQNTCKLKEFIQLKIRSIINQQNFLTVSSINEAIRKENIEEIIQNLSNYYSFINQTHTDLIKSLIFRQISQKLRDRLDQKQKQNIKNQEKNVFYKDQLQKLSVILEQKQAQINKLNSESIKLNQKIQLLTQQNKRRQEIQRKKLQQTNQRKTQIDIEIKKINQSVQYSSQNGRMLLKEIQDQLRQSMTYQKANKQKSDKQPDSKYILQSINKVLYVLQNNQIKMKQDEKMYTQKLVSLQKMNKRLRQRLQELVVQGNSSDVIQKRYCQLQQQMNRKQRQYQNTISQKQLKIQKLRNQLRLNQQSIVYLQSELVMMREKAIDKGKTSQFMQRIIKSKQKLLQQARQQVLNNLSKQKQQIHIIKSQYKQKQLQLTGNLSMFIVQNEQLVAKNTDLNNKITQLSIRMKRQHQQTLLQKQKQIKVLSQQLTRTEQSLSSATDSYMQISKKMQLIIKQKDERIQSINQKLKKTQQKLVSTQKALQQQKQKTSQLKQKYKKAQIGKQQLENKLKREQILATNRIRHIEQNNQKLKMEIKQKQSTFDMMLLQLRSNSLVTNNSFISNNLAKGENKEKYMKRIDHLEQIALKQLQQISNKVYNRQASMSRAYSQAKSVSKNIKHDENSASTYQKKYQYVTDKKPIKQLAETFSDMKTMTTTNLSTNIKSFNNNITQTVRSSTKKN